MGNSNDSMHIGYRIVSVDPNGPMAGLALEPMLDFIVYPDASSQGQSFEDAISSSDTTPLTLTIYNIATQLTRKISVLPTLVHGKKSLGIIARAEDYSTAQYRAIHVLGYLPNSPLEMAGFVPHKDYILGTFGEVFADLDDFETFIKEHNRQRLELFVYNSDTEVVRKVKFWPNHRWSGPGYLGGDFGYGKLHAVPMRRPKEKEPAEKVPKVEAILANNSKIFQAKNGIGENNEKELHAVFKAAIEKAAEIKAAQDSDKNDAVLKAAIERVAEIKVSKGDQLKDRNVELLN